MNEIEKAIEDCKRKIDGYKSDYKCWISECNIEETKLKVLEKQIPLKLEYKNGFAHCKCGCEFESEGYQGEEFCPDCGQKVWVGGYNGEIKDNVIRFR